MVCFPFSHSLIIIYLISKLVFVPSEITRGGFEEEIRDGDEDSDQRLESVASQVTERVLEEEDENDKQVACVSHD